MQDLSAQYILKRSVIGNGGGKTSNEASTVNYTIGQSVVGVSSNESAIGKFGFWYTTSSGPTPVSFTININAGWNLISSYVIPSSLLMTDIWAGKTENLLVLKNGNGDFWFPSLGVGNLENWNILDGYHVYVATDETLTFNGYTVSENTIIPILGWKLVSYLSPYPRPAEQALASIVSKMILVKNALGEIYAPFLEWNTLEQNDPINAGKMIPGKGYYIYTASQAFLDYSNSSTARISSDVQVKIEPRTQHFLLPFENTGNNMSILFESDNIPDGVEIGIFSGSGKLIGSGVVNHGRVAVTVFGENKLSKNTDGASEGDVLSAKAYFPNIGITADVSLTHLFDVVLGGEKTNLVYNNNAIFYARGSVSGVSQDNQLTISPNPVLFTADIQYSILEKSNIRLELFNLQGESVVVLAEGETNAGVHHIAFDIGDLTSGVYNLVLRTDSKNYVQKVIISK
jgi:hypothetical protein